MIKFGIIANPYSGKDIRRIVSGARVISHQEKANIIKRLVAGLKAVGDCEILLMPDGSGLARKITEIGEFDARLVDLSELTGTWRDTYRATSAMVDEGVDVIVTLGGDGTNRIVAKACKDVPLLPISTGTNNAFPQLIEGTLAGLAAAKVARMGDFVKRSCTQKPVLEIVDVRGAVVDVALVDIAIVQSSIRGALAVWDVAEIYAALVTSARADVIGLSAIAGSVVDLGAPAIVHLDQSGTPVQAAIAPGIVDTVRVKSAQVLQEGILVPLGPNGAMLALDGEREIRLTPERPLFARFSTEGPWVVDIQAALSARPNTQTPSRPTKDVAHGT
ncbi:MAG: NAD(+)/NADH kinase [Paracoccaceae bacterium]